MRFTIATSEPKAASDIAADLNAAAGEHSEDPAVFAAIEAVEALAARLLDVSEDMLFAASIQGDTDPTHLVGTHERAVGCRLNIAIDVLRKE